MKHWRWGMVAATGLLVVACGAAWAALEETGSVSVTDLYAQSWLADGSIDYSSFEDEPVTYYDIDHSELTVSTDGLGGWDGDPIYYRASLVKTTSNGDTAIWQSCAQNNMDVTYLEFGHANSDTNTFYPGDHNITGAHYLHYKIQSSGASQYGIQSAHATLSRNAN